MPDIRNPLQKGKEVGQNDGEFIKKKGNLVINLVLKASGLFVVSYCEKGTKKQDDLEEAEEGNMFVCASTLDSVFH